ncbi:MAG: hypothetical protein ABR928_19115 [Terracidiphilus sp.]|jgi:hypothetical protein
MASIGSVRQKIRHAKLHLDFVKAEIQGYLDANQSQFVPHASSTPDHPTFAVKPKSPIPEKIGLFVGDCLQNLRTSLDYLIWELVLVAKNTPSKKNMFPICLTVQAFQSAQRGDLMQGVDSAAIALIESIQPYHDGQPSATSLAILNELTNINKHRRLVLTEFSTLSFSEMSDTLDKWLKAGSPDLSTLAHNTGFDRVVTAEQMKVQGDLIPFVAFNEGAVTGMGVEFTLEGLVAYVSGVVDCFEVFFP